MSADHHLGKLKTLGNDNYITWEYETSAFLRSKGLWENVKGTRTAPNATADAAKNTKFVQESSQVLGFIQMSLDLDQRPHIHGIEDPAVAWAKLHKVHNQKTPSTCFVSYNALFNVEKKDNESLQALSTRVTGLMQKAKDLCTTKFTLDDLDEDLEAGARRIELPAAVVRKNDSLHAGFVRQDRILRRRDTLEDNRHCQGKVR